MCEIYFYMREDLHKTHTLKEMKATDFWFKLPEFVMPKNTVKCLWSHNAFVNIIVHMSVNKNIFFFLVLKFC